MVDGFLPATRHPNARRSRNRHAPHRLSPHVASINEMSARPTNNTEDATAGSYKLQSRRNVNGIPTRNQHTVAPPGLLHSICNLPCSHLHKSIIQILLTARKFSKSCDLPQRLCPLRLTCSCVVEVCPICVWIRYSCPRCWQRVFSCSCRGCSRGGCRLLHWRRLP